MKQITIILILSIAFLGNSLAQIPQTLSYQGMLTNSEGTPISDDDYSITFTLYDAEAGGTNLWTEIQTVSVNTGIFNVILGSITPFDLQFDKQYWLGIAMDGGVELTPRTELTSSAYSLNTHNIPDSIITGIKVADGSIVRSINGYTDDVMIYPGSNIEIMDGGDNSIIISSFGGGSGLTLPYVGSTMATGNAFDITNTGSGATLYSKNDGTGIAGFFDIDNPDNMIDALIGRTNGGGNAGSFIITNNKNSNHAISGETVGLGCAGYFGIRNSSNTNNAIRAFTNGSGCAVIGHSTGNGNAAKFTIGNETNTFAAFYAQTNGMGKAAEFIIENESNRDAAIYATTNGLGHVGKFIITNSSNIKEAIYANTNGSGMTIFAMNNGNGTAGRFEIYNPNNSSSSVQCITNGIGKAIYCAATNNGNIENYGGYFVAKGNKGYGIWAETTNTTGVNYGGHFSTASASGRAIRGHATNTSGENYGGAFRADGDRGRAVWAYGQAYDFYAAGPGVNYGAASSIRWKNNIKEIDNPLDKISELRGVYFEWDENHGGGHDVGMIAEEVGKVIPEIVIYEKNNIDAEGMDYSKITPLLVEAIKAQQKIIEELKADIEELKNLLNNK